MLSSTTAVLITALAVGSTAAPSSSTPKRAIASSTNTNGSIFMFGSASACHNTFWRSGACGLGTYFENKVDHSIPLVAMPSHVFNQYGQDQDNKLCGKVITITHKGVSRKAVVADENTSGEHTIDMCLDLWRAFGGHDQDGTLLKGLKWSISDY